MPEESNGISPGWENKPAKDINDLIAKYGPKRAKEIIFQNIAEAKREIPEWYTFRQLRAKYKGKPRPVIIDGLLRRGEIMNIIAPPKAGKSWLTMALALAVAGGGFFLGKFRCAKGVVGIVDNELHEDTLDSRMAKLCESNTIPEEITDDIWCLPIRGKSKDMFEDSLSDEERASKCLFDNLFTFSTKQSPKLIIIDALYRFVPKGESENDNAFVTRLYSRLDEFALHCGCSIVIVHHTSKGSQGGKATTDVGSGAGAISRACDTHLTLVEHEVEGQLVLKGVARSFAPLDPLVVRFAYPNWRVVEGEDASKEKGKIGRPGDDGKDRMSDEEFAGIIGDRKIDHKSLTDRSILSHGLKVSRNRSRVLMDDFDVRHGLEDFPKPGETKRSAPLKCAGSEMELRVEWQNKKRWYSVHGNGSQE
jgi:hypothetical protein